MAISLSFGVLFATLMTLILVPGFYLILQDISDRVRKLFNSGTTKGQNAIDNPQL